MSLAKSLKEVAKVLNKFKKQQIITGYALIGGLSVSTWGLPRATQDIDLLVSLPSIHDLNAFSEALKEGGLHPEISRGGQLDPVPYLVKVIQDDVPVDMLIATRKWEDEAIINAIEIDFHGAKVPVVRVEYIIAMKLKAGSPRDILDAKELLEIGNADSDLTHELAKRLKVDKKLEKIRS
ncbi:MAG: nucleotidyl transferase AbiEii/AbiGii toxin family protein [Thermodesulfobacteriota bacterium]|nr:MAG: nucleotidyl transferase AbiEii/AbiGii toxin family protein [Thermodesulfobacteriota bacterium]